VLVLDIRILYGSRDEYEDDDEDEVRTLQNTAFDLLVDEKLAADESFRIFITLSNDVLQQLSDGRSSVTSA
jgi:hypothetical protein